VIFLGQDKRLVPNGPKLLSAHRFFVDSQNCGWDSESVGSPIPPKNKPGTSVFSPIMRAFSKVYRGS
jgi:hypothetical protein